MSVSKCKGCILRIRYGHKKECKLTPSGLKEIDDCPCKECLVKVSCSLTCYDLVKIVNIMTKKYRLGRYLKVNSPKTEYHINPSSNLMS